MSDQALRALEQRARSGDRADIYAWVRALERADQLPAPWVQIKGWSQEPRVGGVQLTVSVEIDGIQAPIYSLGLFIDVTPTYRQKIATKEPVSAGLHELVVPYVSLLWHGVQSGTAVQWHATASFLEDLNLLHQQ